MPYRQPQTGSNRWITIYDKAEFPFPNFTKTCECFETQAAIFNEDEQKVYRCAICGAPAVHPDTTREPFQLQLRIIRDQKDPGEWPNFNWLSFPLNPTIHPDHEVK